MGLGSVAGEAAKRDLDPHPCKKGAGTANSHPKAAATRSQPDPAAFPTPPHYGDPAPPRPFPAHRGSSDVPFSATGSSLTFFFP